MSGSVDSQSYQYWRFSAYSHFLTSPLGLSHDRRGRASRVGNAGAGEVPGGRLQGLQRELMANTISFQFNVRFQCISM